MKYSSRVRLGFGVVALAVQLCGGKMLAAQSAPIESSESPGPAKTIVLPDEIPAGESATLAVLDASGKLVPGATLELSTGTRVTTDATGRGLFLAPAQAGTLTARLHDVAAFTSNVILSGIAKPAVAQAPSILALGDRVTLRGPGFHSDASRIRVTLGGEVALVLASSSVSLIALPNPRTPLGKTELSIEVAGRSVMRAPAEVVSLAVKGPTQALAKGKKGVLEIVVSGTKTKVLAEVRNLSPNVVRFPRGDVVQLKTSGGANNIARIEITGVNSGDYSVSARFVSAADASAYSKGAR